jgi:tRNA G18 (ribose-2'-O)-methylase SpoU
VRALEVSRLDDPRLAVFRDVKDRALRDRAGLFLVEGRLGVRRLLEQTRFRPHAVFVTPAAHAALADALAKLPDETPVYVGPKDLLCRVVGYRLHRGCLAAAERGPARDALELLRARGAPAGPLVLLEDVTDPDNVGGVLRNARAFGAAAVWLTPRCADPLSRKATRVSVGASLFVPFATLADVAAAAALLRAAGFAVLAFTPAAEALSIDAAAALLAGVERRALVFGGEGSGLSPAALAAADLRVRIPMAGDVDSLNLATASGIALHRLAGRAP